MLYTRKGDGGETGLYGTTERYPKDDPLFDALGSIDELNSLIGFCRAHEPEDDDSLRAVQEALFIAQAQLAGADKRITQEHVRALEAAILACEALIEKPTSFVIPGATVRSARFDYTRAVSRRAERAVVHACATTASAADLLAYLNRVSSFFYALARQAAQAEEAKEPQPTY
jgi:ATP:cob(I)alamin adenosyltransferase